MSLFGRGPEKASICEELLVLGNFDLAFAVLQTFKVGYFVFCIFFCL
jgi:hypothetical protein